MSILEEISVVFTEREKKNVKALIEQALVRGNWIPNNPEGRPDVRNEHHWRKI